MPHPIDTVEGKGCNHLLANGAVPYLGIESLAGFRENQPETINTSKQKQEQDPIVNLLAQSSTSITTLIQALNSNESIVMDHLLTLELEGKIVIRGDMVSLL